MTFFKGSSRSSKSTAQAKADSSFAPSSQQSDSHENAMNSPMSAESIIRLQRVIGNKAVQRLPTLATFKTNTSITGTFRNKITTLDTLIQQFHALPAVDYGGRLAGLNQIIQACQAYIGLPDNTAKRKPGVQTMYDDANRELPLYLKLVQMEGAGSRRAKYNFAIEAQDLALKEETAGYANLSISSATIKTLIGTLLTAIQQNEPATLNLLAQDDLQRLTDMLNDPTLPLVTHRVITEVLGNMGTVGLAGSPGGPGARLAKPTDNLGASKYKVEHGLNQDLGTTERLGSLVHELTHVAAGESYDNTSSFLMFATTLTVPQLQLLGAARVQEVGALRALCANDPAFNAKQKALLNNKIDYGYEDKLPLYAARFDDAARARLARDPASVDGLRYQRDAQIMLTASASAPGQSSVFIEYETVMNQMLIYMHQWGIPTANPFYAKLRQVAQDAYDARDDARP